MWCATCDHTLTILRAKYKRSFDHPRYYTYSGGLLQNVLRDRIVLRVHDLVENILCGLDPILKVLLG